MFKLMPIGDDGVFGLKMAGVLTDADFQSFVPNLEKVLAPIVPVRVMLDWEDFEGWDEEAAAHAFHFRMAHRSDIERVAVLGGHRCEQDANKLAEDLGDVPVRLFAVGERDKALAWLAA
jgi:hypothetical protein